MTSEMKHRKLRIAWSVRNDKCNSPARSVTYSWLVGVATLFTVLTANDPCRATSGWDKFEVPLHGGYHIQARAIVGESVVDEKQDHFTFAQGPTALMVAFWDTDTKLFVVSYPP